MAPPSHLARRAQLQGQPVELLQLAKLPMLLHMDALRKFFAPANLLEVHTCSGIDHIWGSTTSATNIRRFRS